jgi:hypothetical protein
MNKQIVQVIEYLYVNQDSISENDIWRIIDEISIHDLINIGHYLWQHNTGIQGSIINHMQSIFEQYHNKLQLTKKQHRWLGIAILSNWDNMNFNKRLELEL